MSHHTTGAHDRGLEVLVVDDTPSARLLVKAMLMRRDFQVSEAASATEALQALQDRNIDLMLLDLGMPGLSGIDLCYIVRNDLRMVDLPIVAYTAHGQVADLTHMRLAGFDDFLIKPVSLEALDMVLARVLPPPMPPIPVPREAGAKSP